MTGGAAAQKHRYQALDALRGLCALCVCLFHFRATGPISGLAFVHGSWLFVDFFFVLSGFVIAANYRERLIVGGFLRRFVILRLGRVYPLHVFMLLVFVAMELVGLALDVNGLMQREPFAGSTSVPALFSNLALLQAFGLHPGLTWNGPSWSIAVEFWTYVLFALAARAAGQCLETLLVLAALVSIAILVVATPHGINVSHNWSLFRCIYGFAVGALAWRWWSLRGLSPQPGAAGGTAMELAAVAAVVAFVSFADRFGINLLAPLVFGAALLVFAREAGAVSRLLLAGPLQWLGLLSYSIYMVHTFVQSRFDDVLRVAERPLGIPLTTQGHNAAGGTMDLAGATSLQGMVLTLVMLVLVIGTAAFTQRFVELPGQRLARRIAQRPAAVAH